MARARPVPLVAMLSALLMAGCLSATPPSAAGDPTVPEESRAGRPGDDGVVDGPSGGPPTETTLEFSGNVVLRPACGGCEAYIESGDSASFCFGLPSNVTLLRGVFTYAPRQQAGLEFRILQPPYTHVTSWDGGDLTPQSPITVEVPDPAPGHWFTYGGPGSVGGGMEWHLALTMVTNGVPSPEAVGLFGTIDPSC